MTVKLLSIYDDVETINNIAAWNHLEHCIVPSGDFVVHSQKQKRLSSDVPHYIAESCRWVALDAEVWAPTGTDGTTTDRHLLNMKRDATESPDKTFQRMGLTVLKRAFPKSKAKKKRSSPTVSFKLEELREDETIETASSGTSRTVESLFRSLMVHPKPDVADQPAALSVTIDDVTTIRFDVECCPPTVLSVRTFENFSGRVYADGAPLFVEVSLLFADNFCLDWFVDGVHTLSGTLFVPTNEHIGKTIAVLVTPYRENQKGLAHAFRFQHPVELLPENALLSLRPEWTKPRCNGSNGDTDCHGQNEGQGQDRNLRVISYNVLADANAFSTLAQTAFYPYCDGAILERQRRFPLILHEILQYQPDIVCLQEVDYFVFKRLLKPVMDDVGFQGFYSPKDGGSEGCAMFWSLSRFERVAEKEDQKRYLIRDMFGEDQLDGWQSMGGIRELLDSHDDLGNVVRSKLGHILQTVTLTEKSNDDETDRTDTPSPRKVVVGNTHLFFHPLASHIRLMQMYACCHELEKERQGVHPFIFCGDFNSSPSSGAARLVFDRIVQPIAGAGSIGHGQTTWKNLDVFRWEKDDDTTAGTNSVDPSTRMAPPTVELPDSFPTMQSGYTDLPKFTHYLQSFAATLDYILASNDGFSTVASAAVPTEEMVTKDVGMPSAVLPSDHISLVCDFEWQQQ